jgi:hypothetical protein
VNANKTTTTNRPMSNKYTRELWLEHCKAWVNCNLERRAELAGWQRVSLAEDPPDYLEADPRQYRVREEKPEKMLRCWRPEEAIGKVVRMKGRCRLRIIVGADQTHAQFAANRFIGYGMLVNEYEQQDGSPCGVEE